MASQPQTTTGNLLLLGKICALLSFLAFIINGTLFRVEALVAVEGAFGVASLLVILPYWREFPHFLKVMLVILGAAALMVLFKAFLYEVAYSFVALVASGISVSIYLYKYPGFFKVRPILYGILAYLFIYVAAGGSPEAVFAGSRNQISVVLIALGALALAMESRKSDLVLALAIFLACVISVGSSGIIASSVLLLATIFRQEQRLSLKILAVLAIVSSLIAFQFYVEYYASAEFTAKFSLQRLTGSDPRFQIIHDYFQRYMHGAYLWLGAPDQYLFYVYSPISSGGTYGYVDSLHNSYLSVHAKTGALAVAVFATIVRVIYALRREPYLVAIMLAILVRAFGDSVFILDGYYNFCFYYFFVLASLARAGLRVSPEPPAKAQPVSAPLYA